MAHAKVQHGGSLYGHARKQSRKGRARFTRQLPELKLAGTRKSGGVANKDDQAALHKKIAEDNRYGFNSRW